MDFRVIKTNAKSIFTKTKLPGAKWVINQYVGCEHACVYCYAKFIGRYKPYGKWGTWAEAKINAPELVKGKYVDGWVCMSSVSDPYQPIEKELKLTRRILENLDKRIKLSILTKSDLVLRDIDIFKQFANIEVGLTINSFDAFEPFAPRNNKRIEALKILKQRGIKTYAFISPIIPDLTNLASVINKTKDFADYFWFEMLNLRGAGKDFSLLLEKKFPQSYKKLKNKIEFAGECKDLISKENISVRGFEVH